MTSLLLAVVSASLLGSLHCAGMCGPFALYAATHNDRVHSGRLATYHLGRLMTYLILGLIVGATGQLVDSSGQAIGLPPLAAQLAGAALILLAIAKLWPRKASTEVTPGMIARMIAKTRPTIARLPGAIRPGAIGAVTVLLPCGWLYAFGIVAAGSGGIVPAMLVMSAFWVGTLPWLSGLTLLAKPLALKPQLGRVITAALLAAAGLYTMTGRATADFRPLIQHANASHTGETLKTVTAETPACCLPKPATSTSNEANK